MNILAQLLESSNILENEIRPETSAGSEATEQGLSTFQKRTQGSTDGLQWVGVVEIATDGTYANVRLDAGVVDFETGEFIPRSDLSPDKSDFDRSPTRYDPDKNIPYDSASWKEEEPAGTRQPITGFSKKARGNMLKTVARINAESYKKQDLIFITLTMPDQFDADETNWNRYLKNFCERVRRNYPELAFIWRLELKRRKSGTMKGEIAPHYHLVVFNWSEFVEGKNIRVKTLKQEFREWLSLSWHEIVDGDSNHLKAGTQAKFIRGKRRVTGYLTKYVAKEEDINEGLSDEQIDELLHKAIEALTNEERVLLEAISTKEEPRNCGRFWGIFNRNGVPWSSYIRYVVGHSGQFRIWSLFRYIANIPDDVAWKLPSLSVFCDPVWLIEWMEGNTNHVQIEQGVYG